MDPGLARGYPNKNRGLQHVCVLRASVRHRRRALSASVKAQSAIQGDTENC
jgi:hypothetical protein